jgi:uncharacterized protein (DUF362 family)
MPPFSRRDFLRLMALSMGSAAVSRFLAACSPQPAPATPIPPSPLPPTATRVPPTATQSGQTPQATDAASTAPAEMATLAPSATPAGAPDLAVVRNGDPETLVRRAIAALGGMEMFVSKGANVVIKPNICVAYHTYEYAATTNPWVVGTVVKMCFEAGANSVKVMDYPFGGTAQEAYVKSGIQEQVKAAGGEMAYMPGFKYVTTALPGAVDLKKTDIFGDILNADVLINLPIAKHHSLARLTIGMKNMMGVIRNRSMMHANLGDRLTDLNAFLRPKLTLVDATRILMANGPSGGDLGDVKQLDTVIAGVDVVATDSYATTLFGLQPEDIPYIKVASERGLGRSDLANLRIEELTAG